jgi:hypothetical protein
MERTVSQNNILMLIVLHVSAPVKAIIRHRLKYIEEERVTGRLLNIMQIRVLQASISYILYCFFLGDSPASEFYVQTFRNRQSVPKRQHIKFRRRGITQRERIGHSEQDGS